MAEKKKLKPIPPTLRGKKRYVKFRLICEKELSENGVNDAVWGVFARIFGEKGIAEQRLWLVKWMPQNTGILRCSNLFENEAKAGLLFITKTGGEAVIPLILGVSGSVSKLNQR